MTLPRNTTTSKNIAKEFYTTKSLYTLTGTATSVWLLCAVLSYLDYDTQYIKPQHYRIIAFLFSQLLSITMIFQLADKKRSYYLLGFINGLLIFVHASGINAITYPKTTQSLIKNNKKGELVTFTSKIQSDFFDFFKHQVNWWDNEAIYEVNKNLVIENEKLKQDLKTARNLNSSKKLDTIINSTPINNIPLDINNDDAVAKIEKLKMQLLQLDKDVNQKNHFIDSLRQEFTNCQKNNSNLVNQLNSYSTQLDNCKSQLKRLDDIIRLSGDINITELQKRVRQLERDLAECKEFR